MKPKFKTLDVFVMLFAFVPLAYLLMVYSKLGNTVPLHFGLNGQPDRYGNRSELISVIIILTVVNIGVYLLVKFIPLIDPKKKTMQSAALFQKLAVIASVLSVLIGVAIIYAAQKGAFDFGNIFFAILGIFFAILGNLMYSIKPNYFAGIRTPWTLEDEDTWRKTHQLGSRIWFIGGILIALISFILSKQIMPVVFIVLISVMVLIPVIYSYIYFKKNHKRTLQ